MYCTNEPRDMNRLEELFREILELKEGIAIQELRALTYAPIESLSANEIEGTTNMLVNIKILQSSYISFN